MFALALCGGLATSVQAEVLYSTGFEAPAFSLGSIDGQDGWYPWIVAPVIQTATVHSGSQAAGIDGFGEADHDTNVPVSGQMFSLQCDFMHTGNANNQSGIFLSGDTGFIAQLVSGNSDSGNSWFFLGGFASANHESGVSLADGQWHHLNLILDIAAQSITGYADDHYLGSLAMDTVPFPTAITLFGFYQYAEGDAQSYFDNFSFEAVPAPGAAAILGLAGVMAGRRRR